MLITCVMTSLALSTGVSAEAPESDEKPPVTTAYNTETGMYMYSFADGCGFQASEDLGNEGNTVPVLWLATEDEDIEIRVSLDGIPFAYSPTTVLDIEGLYTVQIYHRHGGNESVIYNVKIAAPNDITETPTASVEGRLELIPDGEFFSYGFGGVGSVFSNVLDGETIGFPAKVTVSPELYCTVTKDGAVYSLPQNGIISENGSYGMEISSYSADGTAETRYFGFNVCIGESNRLGIYHPPFGFSIESVTLNGEPQQHSGDMYRFTRDGEYVITYENGETERSVTLVRDTAAPVLYFNGGSGVVFDSNVAVTADSPCTVTVEKNGMEISGTELKGTGIYRVTAVDTAGNSVSYRIEVRAVSALNPMNFAVIFGVAAIVATVYFIFQKSKKPVVR